MARLVLAEVLASFRKLAKGLRRGHKAASGRRWGEAAESYRLASEVLAPGGPIQRRLADESARMAKLSANPPPDPPRITDT